MNGNKEKWVKVLMCGMKLCIIGMINILVLCKLKISDILNINVGLGDNLPVRKNLCKPQQARLTL